MDEQKFRYGLDIDAYLEKTNEYLKSKYSWFKKRMLNHKYSYKIEEEGGQYQFVEYYNWGKGRIDRTVMDYCDSTERFISHIESNNEFEIMAANPVVESYEVPFSSVDTGGGWWLERYRFQRLKTGDFSVYVQAGNRSTGGGRTFFIPRECFEAENFDEFLDRYQKIVPGSDFGLLKCDLIDDKELCAFLGYTPKETLPAE